MWTIKREICPIFYGLLPRNSAKSKRESWVVGSLSLNLDDVDDADFGGGKLKMQIGFKFFSGLGLKRLDEMQFMIVSVGMNLKPLKGLAC